jgi:putative tricarboxylic transport membrane protein
MDFLSHIILGFSEAVTPVNLLYCFAGCLLGTLIGVLPGLGPPATIAILLPITFSLDPTTSLIMLAGIYYGAQYGGSTTAILVNLPGESSSVVTAIDGYQMARKGQAGLALSTAALASFFAGTVATIAIAIAAPLLASLALTFQAADYFSLMVLGLVACIALAQGSMTKALGMVVCGLLAGLVGTDVITGAPRMTMGTPELIDGLSIVAVAMGIFGLGEIIQNLVEPNEARETQGEAVKATLPSREDLRRIAMPTIRGTLLGSILGILPGGGALLSSFTAYAVEKRISRNKYMFGRGAIEGVAAPEAANNAGAQTSLVPLLTLGLPSNVIAALMAGAMIIQGIQPGPDVMTSQPRLFWGLVASMWIGNLMLVILNLPLIGIWIRLLAVPYSLMFPAILIFCAIGAFSLNFSSFDIWVMVAFGAIGYLFRRLACEPAPFLLGMILGPMLEENFRRAMLLSRGNVLVFFERPISALLLAIAIAAIVSVCMPAIRQKRDEALEE